MRLIAENPEENYKLGSRRKKKREKAVEKYSSALLLLLRFHRRVCVAPVGRILVVVAVVIENLINYRSYEARFKSESKVVASRSRNINPLPRTASSSIPITRSKLRLNPNTTQEGSFVLRPRFRTRITRHLCFTLRRSSIGRSVGRSELRASARCPGGRRDR